VFFNRVTYEFVSLEIFQTETEQSREKLNSERLRMMALHIMTQLEVPVFTERLRGTEDCIQEGLYQCQDCEIPIPVCHTCIVRDHARLPLHRPLKWNGSFMERVKLIDLDFTWHVSHEGQPCPYFADCGGSQNITLIDTTGIHYVNVGFCRCGNAGNFAEQLMLAKLFPASVDQPKTAFTFRCLKLFHMLNLIAHTTAWDFTGMLQRLTDNVDPRGNPVGLIHSIHYSH
jgi:hypothetical protein